MPGRSPTGLADIVQAGTIILTKWDVRSNNILAACAGHKGSPDYVGLKQFGTLHTPPGCGPVDQGNTSFMWLSICCPCDAISYETLHVHGVGKLCLRQQPNINIHLTQAPNGLIQPTLPPILNV